MVPSYLMVTSIASLNQLQEIPLHLPALATVITHSHMHVVQIKYSLAHPQDLIPTLVGMCYRML